LEDADLPVSPRARRLQALERGESDVATAHVSRRQLTHPTASTNTKHITSERNSSRRRRRKSDDTSKDSATGPWGELCGVASPSTILKLLAALLVVLFVLDFTVESLALAFCRRDTQRPADGWLMSVLRADRKNDREEPRLEADEGCSPGVIDLSAIGASRQRHRFYDLLVKRGPPTPPVFTGEFQVLCEPQVRYQSRFGYCLPIGGRTDEPFCSRADRMDLLINSTSATGFCYASVLHMILLEAYEELQALNASPLVAYGTLLGAVRNGTIIPYTEDADIAYAPLAPVDLETFKKRLWDKGYHVFYFTRLWRVCVAPTHPLAAALFTPDKGLTRNYKVPYVDLYEMKPVQYSDGTFWDVFGTKDDRLLPDDKVHPFTSVEINGLAFETFGDPVDFLTDEYGDDFRMPVVRQQKKSNGFNFNEAFLDDEAPKKKTTTTPT
jgi:hypothetical protein